MRFNVKTNQRNYLNMAFSLYLYIQIKYTYLYAYNILQYL